MPILTVRSIKILSSYNDKLFALYSAIRILLELKYKKKYSVDSASDGFSRTYALSVIVGI